MKKLILLLFIPLVSFGQTYNLLNAKNPEDISRELDNDITKDNDITYTYSRCYPELRNLYNSVNLYYPDYHNTVIWLIDKYIPVDGICDVNEEPQYNWNNRSNPIYFTEKDFEYIRANKDPRSNKFELKKGRKIFNFEWNNSASIEFKNLKKFSAKLRKVSFEVELNNCFMLSYKVNYKKGKKINHFTVYGDDVMTFESEDAYGNKWVINKSNFEYYYNDDLLESGQCDYEKNQKIYKSFDSNGSLRYQSITTKFNDSLFDTSGRRIIPTIKRNSMINLSEEVEISLFSEDGDLVARTKFLDDMDEYISNDKIFKFDIFRINKNSQEEFIKSVSFVSIIDVDIDKNTEDMTLEEQLNSDLLERKKLGYFKYTNQIDIFNEIFKLLNLIKTEKED